MKTSGLIIIILLNFNVSHGQSSILNRQQFFLDDRVIEVTLSTDIKQLKNNKKTPAWQPADIIMQFSDTSMIREQIRVRPRGFYRKANCDLAALMVNFKNNSSPRLSPLKSLKLVSSCHSGRDYEELLLKEFVAYKIYNFISVMSFRVRLLHITYQNSKQKSKSNSQYAFLVEDIKDVAERNNCIQKIDKTTKTEATNRQHINLVSLFQYMIGNTDWSVPMAHNIKLIVPKNDTLSPPFPIPYDFDFAGLVNADYALPNEELNISTVKQRLYRGFGRNMSELQINLDIF